MENLQLRGFFKPGSDVRVADRIEGEVEAPLGRDLPDCGSKDFRPALFVETPGIILILGGLSPGKCGLRTRTIVAGKIIRERHQ